MGYKSLIQKSVQGAFKALGTDPDGLASKQTYISVGAGTYDPATRRVTNVEIPHAGIPMVLTGFKLEDKPDDFKPRTDLKALIATADLPVSPTEDDKVQTADGAVYTVMAVMSDPANALQKLHLRRTT